MFCFDLIVFLTIWYAFCSVDVLQSRQGLLDVEFLFLFYFLGGGHNRGGGEHKKGPGRGKLRRGPAGEKKRASGAYSLQAKSSMYVIFF